MKRLLIIKLSSFGDVLHALPVVKSIKQDIPDLSIGWVVRERCAGLVRGAEFIDQTHILSSKPDIAELIKLRNELHDANYDTAFDMQGLFLSGLIAALSGAPRRVGLNRNREFNTLFLTDSSVEGLLPLTHAVDVQLGFRSAAGLKHIPEMPLLCHLGEGHNEWLDQLNGRFATRKVIVLNVGASTIYKRWPLESWAALGNVLTDWGVSVVVTAGADEVIDANFIFEQIADRNAAVNLAGKTNAEQLAVILKRADLVISGDTGPMHLAVALGTPTIALFGPTDPRLTGPYGAIHKTIWKQLACSPCFRHPTCGGRVDCLRAITVDEVFDSAVSQLTGNPRSAMV